MKHKPPPPPPAPPPRVDPRSESGSGSGLVSGKPDVLPLDSNNGDGPVTPSKIGGTANGVTNTQLQVEPNATKQLQPQPQTQAQQIKMPLGSGDMVIMRGPTQSNWLHSIPKRKGRKGDAVRGRINITFRKAIVPAGTNNYYNYNVGSGGLYRWDEGKGEMVLVK